jgi:hypothetical protein
MSDILPPPPPPPPPVDTGAGELKFTNATIAEAYRIEIDSHANDPRFPLKVERWDELYNQYRRVLNDDDAGAIAYIVTTHEPLLRMEHRFAGAALGRAMDAFVTLAKGKSTPPIV